jgi:hypothetical protein
MSPKYDECDKYGWDTTIYKNNHVVKWLNPLTLSVRSQIQFIIIILVLVLKKLIWKRLPKEMLVFVEEPFHK